MRTDNSAVAKSIAEADKHLDSLSVLAGIFVSSIDRARRDLRQIRTDAAAIQGQPEKGHVAANELGADMLG